MDLLAAAVEQVCRESAVPVHEIDGLGVSSFTLGPDHTVDFAFRSGLKLTWIMEDTNGGASGINMLQHAIRAIESGDASNIVLVSGDKLTATTFSTVVDEYNSVTRDYVSPMGMTGPNAMFAMLTQRHQMEHSLTPTDYGKISVAQRTWAQLNPQAVYRSAMTIDDYLGAPEVTSPLRRYDCVPPVSGANAILVTSSVRAEGRPAVSVRSIGSTVNVDLHLSDGLSTGHRQIADKMWQQTGLAPEDMDVISVYDDYPVMVLIQLADLGFSPDGNIAELVRRIYEDRWPVNTSGGQLSAGQAGSAAGLHGLVEVVRQLQNRAGDRQVEGAHFGLVSGYGMVTYRFGACANATILERC